MPLNKQFIYDWTLWGASTLGERVGNCVSRSLAARQALRLTSSASVNRRDGKAPMTIAIVKIVAAFLFCASTVRSK